MKVTPKTITSVALFLFYLERGLLDSKSRASDHVLYVPHGFLFSYERVDFVQAVALLTSLAAVIVFKIISNILKNLAVLFHHFIGH